MKTRDIFGKSTFRLLFGIVVLMMVTGQDRAQQGLLTYRVVVRGFVIKSSDIYFISEEFWGRVLEGSGGFWRFRVIAR